MFDEAVATVRLAQGRPDAVSVTELSAALDLLVEATIKAYDEMAERYRVIRGLETSVADRCSNNAMLRFVRGQISSGRLEVGPGGRWRLLDIGGGYGRDALFFADEPDVEVTILEKSTVFLRSLRELQQNKVLNMVEVVEADMRDLSAIKERTFQCVRSHAALHHLPVAPHRLGVDAAIAEVRRILVDGGIFHCLVRHGHGLHVVDTEEGLGERLFQLFTSDSLSAILERHALEVVQSEVSVETRPGGDLEWLRILAVAA
jgi:SAM-dependent methyltransferase